MNVGQKMSFYEGCFGPENPDLLEEAKAKLSLIRKERIISLNNKFEKRVSEESVDDKEMLSEQQEKEVEAQCDEQKGRLPDTLTDMGLGGLLPGQIVNIGSKQVFDGENTFNMEWEVVRNLSSLSGQTESGVFLNHNSILISIKISLSL